VIAHCLRHHGFETTPLSNFARKRLPEFGFQSEEEIESAVKAATHAGELRYSGYILYYLTARGRDAVSKGAV
jgi:hypothetical protein